MESGASFNQALRSVAGGNFEKRWHEYVSERYRLFSFLQTFSLFTLISLLALVSFVVYLVRRRRARKRWAEEEDLEDHLGIGF
jgi:hypothetical protein